MGFHHTSIDTVRTALSTMKDLLAPLLLVAGTAAVRGQDQCTSKVCLFADPEEEEAAYDWDATDVLSVADLPMIWSEMRGIMSDLNEKKTVTFTMNSTQLPTPVSGKLHPVKSRIYGNKTKIGNCFYIDEDNQTITTYDQNYTDYFLYAQNPSLLPVRVRCCGNETSGPCTISCKCYNLTGVTFAGDFLATMGYDYDYDDDEYYYYYDDFSWAVDDAFDDDDEYLWNATDDDSSNGGDANEHRQLATKCLRRRLNRQLLSGLDLVSEMKQRGEESCLNEDYKLAVQALDSHLMVVAVPQERAKCPMVVADAGYIKDYQELDYKDGVPVLAKHLTIMEINSVAEDEIKSMLIFGNVMTLTHFYSAVQIARTSADKDSPLHGIVGNCATFLLDVMTDLQIDFGKKDMEVKLIHFVSQALMKSKEKDTIVADIKAKISSRTANAWIRLRGDTYVVKKFIKTFLESYKIEKPRED